MRRRPVLLALTFVLVLVGAACGDDDGGTAAGQGPGSPPGRAGGADVDLGRGEELFAQRCATCHGSDLRGTDGGPSLLSIVYEPGHHPDASFRTAITGGSPQHHWGFGDMPPMGQGLSDADIDAVIAYVRSVQQAEGFEE
jgi:mono/diheme cytochrome c family protein